MTSPSVHSVASFFVSRVDTEVDRRLEKRGTDEALALRGRAAVAQAKLAYQLFRDGSRGERWERLASHGAAVQRPLWASTSTKNPRYPDTLYVDDLIGPDTVNTLPESTMRAFEDHGTLARTIDTDVADAARRHAGARSGRRRHGRRRPHPRGPGRRRASRVVRPRARHPRAPRRHASADS